MIKRVNRFLNKYWDAMLMIVAALLAWVKTLCNLLYHFEKDRKG